MLRIIHAQTAKQNADDSVQNNYLSCIKNIGEGILFAAGKGLTQFPIEVNKLIHVKVTKELEALGYRISSRHSQTTGNQSLTIYWNEPISSKFTEGGMVCVDAKSAYRISNDNPNEELDAILEKIEALSNEGKYSLKLTGTISNDVKQILLDHGYKVERERRICSITVTTTISWG